MNKVITQSFSINFYYNIFFTKNLFDINNNILINVLKTNIGVNNKRKIIVIIDEKIVNKNLNLLKCINSYFDYYSKYVILKEKPILLQGGEYIKNSFYYVRLIYQLVKIHKLCRHSFIIVVGGGSLLDVIGYAAATAHRGIRLIRIPTTVLSQNDSGVGVKNSINYFNKKNFIGTFSTPYAVINDINFLNTLDNRYWLGGISEAIKVSLIQNFDFFNFLFNNSSNFIDRNIKAMKILIYKCAKLHINHINSGDPFEMHSSRPLDFGHWFAHKLESFTNYRISHGEAVAVGIVLDSFYSYFIGNLSKNDLKKIILIFINLKFTLYIPEIYISDISIRVIIYQSLCDFREHLGGELTIMILNSIGNGENINNINIDLIYKSLLFIRNINNFNFCL